MPMRSLLLVRMLLVSTMLLLVVACNQEPGYHHFENITDEGWGRSDVRRFATPKVKHTGIYDVFLDLRTTRAYPYAGVSLICEENLWPANSNKRTTFECKFVDERGHLLGTGISRFQYRYYLGERKLNAGDSLTLNISHNMKVPVIEGITDIGVELKINR